MPLVTERIGIEGNQHHPTRKGADFGLVFDCMRVCRTFKGGQANDSRDCDWCGLRPDGGLVQHRLGHRTSDGQTAANAYCKGCSTRALGQSESSAAAADALVLWQG